MAVNTSYAKNRFRLDDRQLVSNPALGLPRVSGRLQPGLGKVRRPYVQNSRDRVEPRLETCIGLLLSTSNVAMNAAGDRSNSNVGVLILLPPSYTQATW
jgi:hypothetical protein